MAHIVWDWNGTLFHDIHAVVSATNAIFAPFGVAPLTVELFRSRFRRPISQFYAGLLGRPLADGEWERLNEAFHDVYRGHLATCTLTPGAAEVLERWRADGGTQSLLSMWRHEELVPKVAEHGIDDAFVRVDGLRERHDDGSKARHLVRHLAALDVAPAEVVVVGDSVDDALAAAHVGARAVLYPGGVDARHALEAVGVPVVDTLADALRYAT